MKRQAVIVALKAERSGLEIARFLKVRRSLSKFAKSLKPLTGIQQQQLNIKCLLRSLIRSEHP